MKPLGCPKCKSKKIWKRGLRYNESGKKQKYQCKECKTWFIEDDGFKKMRYRGKDIARAIHMHSDGLSLDQVRNHLWQYDGIRVTRQAIWFWEKKYSVFLKSRKQLLAHQ